MLVFAVLAALAGAEPAGASGPAEAPAASPAAAAGREDTEVSGVVVTPSREVPEPAWARKLDLDPRGDYGRSAVPYLRRRPVDGCKPMAGGSVSPSGVVGVAVGPVCVKRFTSPFR